MLCCFVFSIHLVDMGTLDLHELILCVSEGVLSQLLCNYTVCIGTFDLHELILCVFEDLLSGYIATYAPFRDDLNSHC